jgi:hypothetical protein
METLIIGDVDLDLGTSREFEKCQDLGLTVIKNGTPTIANPIYREILARQITLGAQLAIEEPTFRWQQPDGTLDMESLLREFQGFWQENSDIWGTKSKYTEAFPHLLLMAFLQRITNGEGRVEREYAAGRGRMDLAIEYKGKWNIIEVKLIRDHQTFDKVKAQGLIQITKYRNIFSSKLRSKDNEQIPCYLIIFDRRSEDKKATWKERISWSVEDNDVTVLGC